MIDDLRLGRIASFAGIAKREAQGERHVRLLAPLAFLSPRNIAASVVGTAPVDLAVTGLAGPALVPDPAGARDLTKRLGSANPWGRTAFNRTDNIQWQQQSSSREPIVGSASNLPEYLADGWRVFAACRNPDAASKLRCLAQDTGGMLNVVAMDVTDAQSVRNAATQLKDVAIDVLISSAGIAGASGQKTGNVDYESWAHVFNVNTMGPLRVVESFRDQIARSERNLVITITSGMGSLAGNTSGGSIAYRSSKAAVNMVMRSAAIDLAARGITCVLVNPGWVRTDMGGPKAPLSPQESVTAMRRLIDTFGPNDSGKFYNYGGREYPW